MVPEIALALAVIYVLLSLVVPLMVVRIVLEEVRGKRVPALLYHRIIKEADAHRDEEKVYVNTDSDFARQMEYLAEEGYTTLTLDQFYDCLEGRESLPEKPIVITFDDGFQSNHSLALPILKKHGFSAVIFCTTDCDAKNFHEYADLDVPLVEEEMKELVAGGVSLQSHGHTHSYMTRLTEEELERDLDQCQSILEEATGEKVRYIAMPFGACNDQVVEILKKKGYRLNFSGDRGTNSVNSNPFDLKRIVVEREFDLDDFTTALSPKGVIRDRILGMVRKDIPMKILGEFGTARLRKLVYGNSLFSLLMKPTFLRLFVAGGALMGAALWLAGLWWILHYFQIV